MVLYNHFFIMVTFRGDFMGSNDNGYYIFDNELIDKIYNNNLSSNDVRIISYIGLVISIVDNRFKTVNYDKKDLVSVGILGLINAVNNFDKNIGFFINYAEVCISNEILKFLRNINKDNYYIKCKYSDLDNILYSEDVLDSYLIKEKNNYLYNLINDLTGKKKDIIIMYFGFFGNRRYTQEEISKVLDVSQSYISRVICQVINEFRLELSTCDLFDEDKIYRRKI